MKGRAADIIVFSVFTAVMVTVAAVLFYLNRDQRRQPMLSEYSTYRSDEQGAQAFYELLAKLGYTLERREQTLRHNGKEQVFFMLSPALIHPGEIEVILDRVEQGMLLVVAHSGFNTLYANLGAYVSFSSSLETDAVPAQPSIYTKDVSSIKSTGWTYFNKLGGGCPLISQDGRAKVISIKKGAGEIILFSDPHPFSNIGISQADNVKFIVNLVKYNVDPEEGDLIAFDEYHHGFSEDKNILAFLRTRNLQYALAQIMVVAVLTAWLFGKRLGDPVPRPDSEQVKVREAAEYAEALAQLGQKAGLGNHMFRLVYGDYRRRLCYKLGLMPSAENKRIGQAMHEQKWPAVGSVQSLLYESENALRQGQLDDREMLRLVRKMNLD